VKLNADLLFANKNGKDTHQLSARQLYALKKIYAGPANPRTGEKIYTGPPPGSEATNGSLSFEQTEAGVVSLFYPFRWAFGAGFNYGSFDFDKQLAVLDSILAPILNANNPDLSGLQKAGGKLIMYSGSADALVPFQDAIHYYERVVSQQGSLKRTQGFFRYFVIPGMGHCGGGPGINDFGQSIVTAAKQDSDHDILLALVKWVEEGIAPDKIIAGSLNCCSLGNGPAPQRPVFPYPKFPEYTGGDANAPSSFKAVNHQRGRVVVPAAKYLR
jgi:feruloyl esterase